MIRPHDIIYSANVYGKVRISVHLFGCVWDNCLNFFKKKGKEQTMEYCVYFGSHNFLLENFRKYVMAGILEIGHFILFKALSEMSIRKF